MPALTQFYGLRPWEFEDMTRDEIAEYVRYYDDFVRRLSSKPAGR